MDLEFSLSEDKKQELFNLIDEIEELIELAEEARHNEDFDETERYLNTANEMVDDQMDELCSEVDGYEEQKDTWRSGQQALRDRQYEAAIEDMKNFIQQFK